MAGYIEEPWLVPWTSQWKSQRRSMIYCYTSFSGKLIHPCSIRFVDFAMSRVHMLIHFGITPYLVFDGDYLPSKALTEVQRDGKRAESRRVGLELHRMGKTYQAQLEFQRAVDVTPEMARQMIDELKRHNIQYVVSPYEADAQLVYLERNNIIQGILSEDSDMLVFGAHRLLTKLDQYGNCIEINRDDFTACREISLVGWSQAEFRTMAILSGCDYLANINKMGLRTAYRLVRKHKTIEKILRILQFDGQYRIPPKYLEDFQKAELTFLHQRVYCPNETRLVMTTQPKDGLELRDLDFIGKNIEPDIAQAVAAGDLHPMTKKPLVTERKNRNMPKSLFPASRRQSIATPDLKPKLSIEDFFKARRVPLAELDPNSFTPSPSQQRLVEQQNNAGYSSSPAHQTTPIGHNTPTPSSRQSVTPLNTTVTQTNHRIISVSAQHLSKRQRLCEDSMSGEAAAESTGTKVETNRSRFFPPSAPVCSSVVQERNQTDVKAREMNIWSDDSIEDVMSQLAESSNNGQESMKKKKYLMYEDKEVQIGQREIKDNRPSCNETPPSTLPSGLRRLSRFAFTKATASATPRINKFQSPMTSSKGLKATKAQSAVQPGTASSISFPSPPLKPLVLDPEQIPTSLIQETNPLGDSPARQLQEDQPNLSPAVPASQNSPFLPAAKNEGRNSSTSPTIHVSQSPEPSRGILIHGSEDFLVAESEDEGDGKSEWEARSEMRPRLDLGRFAYTEITRQPT